jgi:predicted  nucleic acid-binding Zn-ribbon protein
MHSDLVHLIRLQELDSSAERDRRRIADVPAAQESLDARMAAVTATVDGVKQRIAANQAARREIDKDLAAYQARLSKFKNQLMEVKTNKEYQAMQKEMGTAEEDISAQETKMLERMEEADGLARELKAAEAALKAEQAAVNAEKAKLDEARGIAERDLEKVLGERTGVVAQLSREALALFERIAHGRRGIAVAEARDGLCTLCHVRMRPQTYNDVRRNDMLVQCESCTRILYFVPTAAAPGATPQPS